VGQLLSVATPAAIRQRTADGDSAADIARKHSECAPRQVLVFDRDQPKLCVALARHHPTTPPQRTPLLGDLCLNSAGFDAIAALFPVDAAGHAAPLDEDAGDAMDTGD